MKLAMFCLLIAITCTACSDNDIQINLEKADLQENSTARTNKKRSIYIEFDNPENDKVTLSSQDQPIESEALEQTHEKNYGQLLEEKIELSLQETVDAHKEATPMEVINEQMAELLEESDEAVLEKSPKEVLQERFIKAINEKPDKGSDTDEFLIKQRDASPTEIDDTKFTPTYGFRSIKENSDGFGFTVDLSGDYLFEFDQDILTLKAKVTLQDIVTRYKQYNGTRIDIAGHTDSRGSSSYNAALSQRRANSVKQWFESQGISATLITATGYGEAQPVAENTKDDQDNPDGRRLNRRINITIKTTNKIEQSLNNP